MTKINDQVIHDVHTRTLRDAIQLVAIALGEALIENINLKNENEELKKEILELKKSTQN